MHEEGVEVSFDTQNILKIDNFKYPESIIQRCGNIDQDTAHRISAVWMKWRLASESCVIRRYHLNSNVSSIK